jgi:hypothetical protein
LFLHLVISFLHFAILFLHFTVLYLHFPILLLLSPTLILLAFSHAKTKMDRCSMQKQDHQMQKWKQIDIRCKNENQWCHKWDILDTCCKIHLDVAAKTSLFCPIKTVIKSTCGHLVLYLAIVYIFIDILRDFEVFSFFKVNEEIYW